MRFLVTGGQGFIGRRVVSALLAHADVDVVAVGRSPQDTRFFTHTISQGGVRRRAPLPRDLYPQESPRLRYERADLTDSAALQLAIERAEPHIVVHLASGLRDDDPARLIETNILGTVQLMTALSRCAVKPSRVIVGSSGSVYGAVPPSRLPISENESRRPLDPYAASKSAAEDYARIVCDAGEMSVVMARIFNVVGAGQDERHVCGRFAAQIVNVVRGDAAAQMEVGDLRPTRDFVDVRDVADALVAIARAPAVEAVYNVGSGRETSVEYVLQSLLRLAGCESRMQTTRRYVRAGDISRVRADVSRLRRLGFTPRFTLEQSLRDVLGYYQDVTSAAG